MAQPYGMSELGAVLGLAKSSLTGLVDRSERNGLVQRRPDPQDSRAVRVALTRRGAKVADGFHAETCRRVEELISEFGPAEHDTLAALLGRVVAENKVPTVFLEPDRVRLTCSSYHESIWFVIRTQSVTSDCRPTVAHGGENIVRT